MGGSLGDAEQRDVLAIYTEWLEGRCSPEELRAWLDQATIDRWPLEDRLLLGELRGLLTHPKMDSVCRDLGDHAVFDHFDGVTIYSGRSNTGIVTMLAAAAGVTVTAAVIPFLQSLATQAGQRAFEAARAATRRLIGTRDSAPDIHGGRLKVFVEETPAGPRFQVPPRLPDEALAALAQSDLEALAAPGVNGGTVTIFWDEDQKQWCRHLDGV